MSIDEEPFILVTSKRHNSKNSRRSCLPKKEFQQIRGKNFHVTSEDDVETFDKAAELR